MHHGDISKILNRDSRTFILGTSRLPSQARGGPVRTTPGHVNSVTSSAKKDRASARAGGQSPADLFGGPRVALDALRAGSGCRLQVSNSVTEAEAEMVPSKARKAGDVMCGPSRFQPYT